MGGLFGGGQSISTSAQRIGALRIQSSAYGLSIPITWGRTRISANLIWYGNFIATAHTVESSGGKGGEVSSSNTTYTYTAGVALALGEGPISSIDNIWATKKQAKLSDLGLTGFLGLYPQATWGFLDAYAPNESLQYNGLAYVATGYYDLGDSAQLPNHSFEITGHLSAGALGGVKTFTASAPTIGANKTFTTTTNPLALEPGLGGIGQPPYTTLLNSTAHGFVVNDVVTTASTGVLPINLSTGLDYFVISAGTNAYSLSKTLGGPAILPVGAGTGVHRANKKTYINTLTSTANGFINDTLVRVSTTGTLPSPLVANKDYFIKTALTNSVELALTPGGDSIKMLTAGTGTHSLFSFKLDANPKDILSDFLTNVNYGVGFPSGNVDTLTAYSNYCIANGLFLSPHLSEQVAAQEFINTEILKATNSQVLWSEKLFKVAPYGDTVVTGNGVTYTPNTVPAYDLTDDDFLSDGEDPILVMRKTQADAFNQVQVEYQDRNNQYNVAIAEAKDQANIEAYGLRPMEIVKLHAIQDSVTANFAAFALLNRALYIRNQYQFTVGWKYCLLEPIIDFVTLTDAKLGLNKTPVRILSIEEDEDDNLLITAEEVPGGVAQPSTYGSTSGLGTVINYNVSPGSIQTPVFVNAPGRLTVTGYEIWVALASTDLNWGGCQVWTSYDNATYKLAGIHYGESRFGYLTSDLSTGVDPDISETLTVDLSISLGDLAPASQLDVDNFATLMVVDQELVAYRDATLTSANNYNLTYLRRGCYGTTIAAHANGAPIARLDDQVFKASLDPDFLQTEIFFKFPSFNQYGQALEDISSLPAYSFTPGGSTSYPKDVQNFFAAQNGSVVLFQWQFIEAPNIAGYEIRFNPIGNTLWEDATPVTRVTRGTQITTVKVPPGSWTFLIAANDSSNRYSVTPARYDLNVSNDLFVVNTRDETLLWETGTLVNYVIDKWNRKLVPTSLSLMNAYSDFTAWNSVIPNPSLNQSYEVPEQDLGLDVVIRVYGEVFSALIPGTTGISDTDNFIDFKPDAGAYSGYKAWGIGTFTARYIKQKFTTLTSIGLSIIYGYNPTIDSTPRTEENSNVTVYLGGTEIFFTKPFAFQPAISTQLVSATAGSVSIISQTPISFIVKVFNAAGTDTGGTINWQVKGV